MKALYGICMIRNRTVNVDLNRVLDLWRGGNDTRAIRNILVTIDSISTEEAHVANALAAYFDARHEVNNGEPVYA